MVRRTREEAQTTRASLLDAAEKVFHEKGVVRTSLHDIAQAAGTTRGAIYWHFKDKVDLFNAMMDRVTLPLEAMCAADQEVDDAVLLPWLHALVSRMLCGIEHDERTRRVFEIAMYRAEYVGDLVAMQQRRMASRTRVHDLLESVFQRAACWHAIELPLGPQAAATGLHALIDGLLHTWLLGPTRFDLSKVGESAVAAYLRGLGFRPMTQAGSDDQAGLC